jgi:predicted negative regulator of RcsB-dependent stress response
MATMPMKETYTYYDDLVQFLYHEMPAVEAVEMAHLIEEDADVHAMFQTLQLAKTQLPKVQFNPSQAVLSNILQYSTKTALEARL